MRKKEVRLTRDQPTKKPSGLGIVASICSRHITFVDRNALCKPESEQVAKHGGSIERGYAIATKPGVEFVSTDPRLRQRSVTLSELAQFGSVFGAHFFSSSLVIIEFA